MFGEALLVLRVHGVDLAVHHVAGEGGLDEEPQFGQSGSGGWLLIFVLGFVLFFFWGGGWSPTFWGGSLFSKKEKRLKKAYPQKRPTKDIERVIKKKYQQRAIQGKNR